MKIKKKENLLAINKLMKLYVEMATQMVETLVPKDKRDELYFILETRNNSFKDSVNINISLSREKNMKSGKFEFFIPFGASNTNEYLDVSFSEILSKIADSSKKVGVLNIGSSGAFNGDLNTTNTNLDLLNSTGLSVELYGKFAKEVKKQEMEDFLSLVSSDNYDFPSIKRVAERYQQTGNTYRQASQYFSSQSGPFFRKVESPEVVDKYFGSLMESAILLNGNRKEENGYIMNEVFPLLENLKDDISNEYKNEILAKGFLSSSKIKNAQILTFAERFIGLSNITHPKLLEAKKELDEMETGPLIKEVDVSSLVFLNPDVNAFATIKFGTTSVGDNIKINSVKKEDVYDLILMVTGLLQNAGFKEELGIKDIKKLKLPALGTSIVLDVDRDKFNLEFYQKVIQETMPIITAKTLKENPIGTFISYTNNKQAIENIMPYVLRHNISGILNVAEDNTPDTEGNQNAFKI